MSKTWPRPSWKDITAYTGPGGHTPRGAASPNTGEVRSERLRIVVTSAHRDHRGEWVMFAYGPGLHIDIKPLDLAATVPSVVARASAVEVVKSHAKNMLRDADRISAVRVDGGK